MSDKEFFLEVAMETLTKPVAIVAEQPKLSMGQEQMISLSLEDWDIALNMLVRRQWNSKHKIPAKRGLIKLLEPRCDYLEKIFLLCERVHASQLATDESLPYRHAGEWFQAIYGEIVKSVVISTIASNRQGSDDPEKKRKLIRSAKARCTKSASATFENPFSQKNLPHMHRLIEISRKLAQSSNKFHVNYYRPYIQSQRKHIQSLEGQEFKRHAINENGDLLVQMGKGSHAINLTNKLRFSEPLP